MKILKSIGQFILRYKKKLVYGVLAFLCAQIFLFNFGGIGIQNQVFADEESATQSESFEQRAAKWTEFVGSAEKFMYVVLYPFLFLAGKLVDNSMVYGEVLGFDAILWNLWNIVRNLANFGLGFIFIYNVAKILISKKNDGIKKLLINSLVAGVGIQASWFIMAALIDVSTIAAYGIGGLPLSVLGSDSDTQNSSTSGNGGNKNNQKYDPYVLGTSVYVDADDSDTVRLYLVNGSGENGLYISPCETFTYTVKLDGEGKTGADSGKNEELIIAPSWIYYLDDGEAYPTQQQMCHHYGMIYYLSPLVPKGSFEGTGWKEAQMKYSTELKKTITSYQQETKESIEISIGDGDLLQIGDAHASGGIVGPVFQGIKYAEGEQIGLDVDNNWVGHGKSLPRLSSLLKTTENGGTFLGVFTVLYTSLLNAGTNMKINVSGNGVWSGLLNVFLSFAHVCGIGIPLIVMVLVLFIRIFVLRLAIALSPVIILMKAFDFEKNVFKDGFLKHLQISNLVSVIFAPMLVCFAVSLSTVLVRKVSELNIIDIATESKKILGGLITLNIGSAGVGLGKLLVSVICVVLTWVLMWWAIEATSIGKEKWVGNLKKLATDSLGSIPIVPVIGKDKNGNLQTKFVGTKAAFGENGEGGIISQLESRLQSDYSKQSQETINSIFDETKVENDAAENRYNAYSSEIFKLSGFTGSWTDEAIEIGENENNKQKIKFTDLSAEKQADMIEQINTLPEKSDREKFKGVKKITVAGKGNYVFDDNTAHYNLS